MVEKIDANMVASLFFNDILKKAQNKALEIFIEKYNIVKQNIDIKMSVYNLDRAFIKIDDIKCKIPEELLIEYESFVCEEVVDIVEKIINNAKEKTI